LVDVFILSMVVEKKQNFKLVFFLLLSASLRMVLQKKTSMEWRLFILA
jgi:hypothetical protein